MRKLGVATKVLGGLAAFCVLAFAPLNSASAGCGDYLTIDHGASTNGKHGDSPMMPATAPCNGPNCHRHDGPPVTPSPEFRSAPFTVKSATLLSSVDSNDDSFTERLSDDDVRPIPGFAASILRPPQNV